MIHTMKTKHKMITTNIRLSEPDWLQTKSIAAELGMSLNQYVAHVVTSANKSKAFVSTESDNDVIWQLPQIAPDPKKYQPKGLSEDDQQIYS